jgi:hypothetical protein
LRRQHAVEPDLLDVQDLAAQRQIARNWRLRRWLAEPPALSPSMMKISL